MALRVLPVDGEWVGRMVELLHVPWQRQPVEEVLSVAAPIEWGGGAGAPHTFEGGWRLELGDPPDGDDSNAYVRLPAALFWPAFGAEHDESAGSEYAEDSAAFDEFDEFDEDDDGEFEAEEDTDGEAVWAWQRLPQARRTAFHAEYRRLEALISQRLGDPAHRVVDDECADAHRTVWLRGRRALVLQRMDDINSYSEYDVLAILVCPAGTPFALPKPIA